MPPKDHPRQVTPYTVILGETSAKLKISFGSQSDAGAKTREILMTVLHTLKRTTDVTVVFKSVPDKLAENS